MTHRKILLALLLALPLAAAAVLGPREARGDADADAAKKALDAAVRRGQGLWRQSWSPGAKGCFACHTRGPNKMTAARAASYPKYDKALGRVVTVQQKLNSMIRSKSGGKELELGSDDLNGLEAYLKTLR